MPPIEANPAAPLVVEYSQRCIDPTFPVRVINPLFEPAQIVLLSANTPPTAAGLTVTCREVQVVLLQSPSALTKYVVV